MHPWTAVCWMQSPPAQGVLLLRAQTSIIREGQREPLRDAVQAADGHQQVCSHLLLAQQPARGRDAPRGRVEIDPEALMRNPQPWIRLNEGAQKAAADALLLCGQTTLRRLSARMDRETAQAVFKASGLG
ncbi:hypothetical protein [Streptomyces sp. MMG1121]|uniref:hypothetical protein n=1 Tax=Streptomyces sp. MMG1121 TaxID=1415544 RepID=UPI000ACA4999|nr:hypothetical protein [Streptomyces sp. MMG1121]